MAILVPHYALSKKLGAARFEISCRTVGELLAECSRRFGVEFDEEMKAATMFINGRNITYLKGSKTVLAADDEVWTVIPSAGG